MIKVESIILYKLRNNEHAQLMSDADDLFVRFKNELPLEATYPTFKSTLTTEQLALRNEKSSLKSKTLSLLDDQRDDTWNALNNVIDGMLLSPIAAEAASAEVVKHVMDKYGDVRYLSYKEENSKLKSLVADLQSPTYTTHLQNLRITTWVNELKNQNEQFLLAFNERNTELVNRESISVRDVRQVIDPLYTAMIESINASLVLNIAKPEVVKFVEELNKQIQYFKKGIALRRGRRMMNENEVAAQ